MESEENETLKKDIMYTSQIDGSAVSFSTAEYVSNVLETHHSGSMANPGYPLERTKEPPEANPKK
jgi:hypothetical protein